MGMPRIESLGTQKECPERRVNYLLRVKCSESISYKRRQAYIDWRDRTSAAALEIASA
jgi:hypothetical protein